MRSSFVFPDNVSSFCHCGSKTFCLFPANLATQGNITRNSVSATMFPSLARPLVRVPKLMHYVTLNGGPRRLFCKSKDEPSLIFWSSRQALMFKKWAVLTLEGVLISTCRSSKLILSVGIYISIIYLILDSWGYLMIFSFDWSHDWWN